MDADVVAQNVVRQIFRRGCFKLVAQASFHLCEEALCCPAFLEKEVLHAGAVAALAQPPLVAEKLGDDADDPQGLRLWDPGVELDGKVRVCGKPTADADGEAFFAAPCALA